MKYIILTILLFSCSSRIVKKISDLEVKGAKKQERIFNTYWTMNLDPGYETGNLPIALASPLVYDNVVFVGSAGGYFKAFDIEKRRLLWQEKTKGAMHSGAAVSEGSIYYGDISGRLYSKNLNSGELNYSLDLGAPIDSTPVIDKGRVFIHTRNHKVFALDKQTGKILWSYKRSVPYFSTVQRTSRPLVVANRVFVGFADGYLVSFSVEEGQVIWEKKLAVSNKFVDVDMTPTYFNFKLIVGSIDGNLEVLDPQSGVLYKRFPFSTNRQGERLGNNIVFGDLDGNLILIDNNFNITRQSKVSKNQISNIKKWKNGLVVTTVGRDVYFVDQNFKGVDKLGLGSEYSAVFGDISVSRDYLAIYSSRNRVYLFK